jgi:hypothetical protein
MLAEVAVLQEMAATLQEALEAQVVLVVVAQVAQLVVALAAQEYFTFFTRR